MKDAFLLSSSIITVWIITDLIVIAFEALQDEYHDYSLQDGRPSRGSFYDQDEGNNSLGSWYADSSSDGAAPTAAVGGRPSGLQQLPLMEQSPSLRKNRYFFQSSDGVNENGIANITEVEGHLESGKSLLTDNRKRIPSGSDQVRPIGNGVGTLKGNSGVGRLFTRFLPSNLSGSRKGTNDNFEQGRKEALMEEALVREKTLMDVLKSVTRSKSRENVIDDSVNMNVRLENSDGQNIELGGANDPVKKLPTIGRTIDRSRKYRPMENLSETPVKRKSGLDRLKKMKNDMFGSRKESKDATEMTVEKVESGSIQFQLQKADPERHPEGQDNTQTSSIDGQAREPIIRGQLAAEVERERKESESAGRERRESGSGSRERERHASGSGSIKRERHNSGSGTFRERQNSGSFISRERRESESQEVNQQKLGHVRRPSDGSGIPQLIRQNSTESQPKSILSPKSSLSDPSGNAPSRNVSARFDLPPSEPDDQTPTASTQTSRTPERPVRVSGFGVTENSLAAKQKSAIRRSTRNLSLTSNPKLNTIHEPSEIQSSLTDETGSKVRHRSLVSGDGDGDDPRSNAKVSQRTSVATGPGGLYFFDGKQWRQGDVGGQMIVRSDDNLNRMMNQSTGNQLASSKSTDSVHVTRIKVEKENEGARKLEKKKEERKKDKKKDRKRKDKVKDKDKSKKRKSESSKTRRKSVSDSESSDSSDSSSDSDSDDSMSDSSESTSSSSSSSSDGRSSKKVKSRDSSSKKDKKSRSKDKEKKEKKKSKKAKRSRSRSASPDKKDKSKKGRKSSTDHDEKDDHKKSRRRTLSKSESHENAKDGATLEAGTSQSQPLYDNLDVVRLVSPPPSWAKVQLVPGSNQPQSDFYLAQATGEDGQEVAYYTTATLPSGASLRRAGFSVHDAPRLVAVSERGKSEPRIIVAPGERGATLDRYTMTGRSKSQERVPVKLRRQTVHQDTMQYLKVSPPTGQAVSTVAAASSALPGPGRTRSMSMTAEAPEVWEVIQHQQNNPHLYRTSVEYDSLGEAYTVHQSASGRPVHSIGYKNESRKMTAPIMEPQHMWGRDQGRHHHHHHTAEAKLVIHPSEELLYQQQQQRQHQPGYR